MVDRVHPLGPSHPSPDPQKDPRNASPLSHILPVRGCPIFPSSTAPSLCAILQRPVLLPLHRRPQLQSPQDAELRSPWQAQQPVLAGARLVKDARGDDDDDDDEPVCDERQCCCDWRDGRPPASAEPPAATAAAAAAPGRGGLSRPQRPQRSRLRPLAQRQRQRQQSCQLERDPPFSLVVVP